MNEHGAEPAGVFGYCANVHSLGDFLESFPSLENKARAIIKAGKKN